MWTYSYKIWEKVRTYHCMLPLSNKGKENGTGKRKFMGTLRTIYKKKHYKLLLVIHFMKIERVGICSI